MNRFLVITAFFFYSSALFSQITIADYSRADSITKFNDLVYNSYVSPVWTEGSNDFWYSIRTRQGREYYKVNTASLKKSKAVDQERLCDKLNGLLKTNYKPEKLWLNDVSFSNGYKKLEFVFDSIRYQCSLNDYKLVRGERVKPGIKPGYWNESKDEFGNPPVMSPDSAWMAYLKNFNIYIRNRKTNREYSLSFDGSEGESYSSAICWSPDSKYLAVNKVRANTKHFIYFVESSPKSQLQPILQKRDYLKPGDALPVKWPSLFSVEEKRQIPVDGRSFQNQYELSDPQWYKDSRGFTFEYNQRGHQVYQVVEVKVPDGGVKTLIDERSRTFIDYSGKHYRFDVNDGKEIIWASERDGWNHLYLIDGLTGAVKNPIISGNWVLREVVYVNEAQRYILFKGSGKNQEEDPYLIHYYRVNFDGSGLCDLTPVHSNHEAFFSKDYKFFVDNYSKVNQPMVSVLRSAIDGRELMPLERADIADLMAKGWVAPEPFVAKGRDGKTDIWGNIYRPVNFDSTKVYPVIEYIYAGPHDSFVTKSFRAVNAPFSGLAELGFIIVQIDGMGTSNRSKAFHDVCWKNLKDAGFPDRICWIKAAASQYSYMDTSRVGIFGASAGGQNALAALLFHPEFYKASVASCGCHDNRMDKIWWNEQWMGYPVGPQYEECSNVVNARKLKGSLMLIVGEVDDNVDPASTMQVADALIKANKEFDLLVLPGVNHTLGGKYGERKRRDFFVKHLLKQETPVWNKY